jgi:hypothetical protein
MHNALLDVLTINVLLNRAMKIQSGLTAQKTGATSKQTKINSVAKPPLTMRNANGMLKIALINSAKQQMVRKIFTAKQPGVLKLHHHQDVGIHLLHLKHHANMEKIQIATLLSAMRIQL